MISDDDDSIASKLASTVGTVDRGAVAEHVGRLTAALGKHHDFMPILGELKDMPREHLVAVANGFNGPMAPSTSKTKAIERIYSRHRKLMEFTNNPYDRSAGM